VDNSTNKTCPDCKESLPIGSFRPKSMAGKTYRLCSTCRRARNLAYYAANKVRISAQAQARYAADPDRYIKAAERYQAANASECRMRADQYRESHREEIAAYRRSWDSENRDARNAYHRAWGAENQDKVAGKNARRRALKAAVFSLPFSHVELAGRMAYFGNRCWMCRGPFEHVDHVKPIAKGGPNILSNLRPACGRCNSSKCDKWFGAAGLKAFAR